MASLNVNVVLFGARGSTRAHAAANVDRIVGAQPLEFARGDFQTVGAFDWADVDLIVVIAQSGTAIGGNDFAMTRISAE